MLDFNEETIDWAMGQMDRMKHLRGFPELAVGVEAVAAALLRIAHPVLVSLRWDWNISGNVPEQFSPRQEQINPGKEKLETDNIRGVHPMKWMIDYALDNHTFFPAPVELRRIFQERFPTADGESASPAPMKGGA
jgi:hypothetical protein